MAVKPIGTTALTWGSLLGRGNREPIDATQLNYSYTDLLWELNQRTVSYQIGVNNGGSGNYYVGLITAVPYVNEDDKRKDSHYTVDANGNKKLETIDMKGPWYVSYKGTDKGRGTAQNKYGFVPDGNPNTYYADRIVLKQEMDYTLDNGFVRKTQLGTYYTGVGHWYDSYTKSKTYANGLECPDGVYFPTTSYAEIFNDYTYNVATGDFSHSEGKQNTVNGEASHAEGYGNTINAIHAHAEGHTNTVSADDSHAEGQGNSVSGEYAHAEGYHNNVLSNAGHAEGNTTTVSAVNAHTEGKSTYVHSTAENSHAEGIGSYTKGANAHAENSSYANGKNSHSGGEATAGGVNSFAHGIKGTLASGVNSVAFVSGTASGNSSVAIKGTASGSNSIAFTGTASGENSISLDGTASGSNSVSIQGTAKSTDSVAIGQGAIAETGQGAMGLIKGHATGQQSLAANASSASGTNSVAMNASSASNTQSFAVNNSTASGINSASTNKGTASGENSISTNISTATGINSAALNNGNASGEGSVAMNYSKATGKGSVAIGLNTIASGEYSLSNGHETRANNHDSHAEGYGTNASGNQSHTEGIVTTTNGLASHAEGQGSITGTNATAAHVEGSYTIANNESEHAQGKYNVSDTENSGTLFTIGNGTSNGNRHNVVGIYHNGDINIEGPNTTNHNTGYFKTTVDGSHTEVVRGNYTQTIGTTGKNNTCNITVNGNTTNRFNGTSDTRTTGATYEGYGSTFISTTKGAKYIYSYSTTYIHSSSNVTNTTAGTRTNITDGYVSETNKSSIGTYTTGTSYQYTSSNKTDAVGGTRTNITDGYVSETNKSSIGTYTTGTSYQYTSSNKTDAVGGTRTNITVGNVNVTTRGAHTESITNERSFTVGKHDSLTVSSGGRTEKITGEKITQVVSGNINAYTDDTHDTRLHTRSTYIETVHTYIGNKTNTYISGNYSVGLGQGIKVSSNTNVSTGKFNKDEASYFAVGIGTSDTNRKNAFWISQGTTAGTNGVGYFSNNTYVYGNTYDPSQYPNNKEDKSWSVAVTYNMYRNSYAYLYKTMNDKFDTFGTSTYFTKSIDPFTYTPVSYTLHYTTQTFNNKENSWPTVKHQYVLSQAIPGALENDNSGMAGLMSARDKARLDSIWEGDKQIAGIQISTGSWQVFKDDGSTYTLANIKHQSNSITNLKVEYGFKVKWSGTWKWTVNNQKNAEECKGAWGTTLPAVNTNSSTYTSPVLSGNGTGNWSQICYETIYAAKRGLIISGYPDDYAASSNGSRHLGSIVPASGKDNRSCSVSWATYRLLFYGMCTQAEADGLKIDVMKTKTTKDITGKSWTINYTSDSSHCFFMAYPAAFGNIATIKKNGVEIITSSFLKVGAVNYTNGAGYTQQYYVYRSGVGAAGMSITIS